MIDERLEVVRPAVAVIDVVGVLPDVAAEDRLGALHQRAFAVGGLHDRELAVLDGDPAPARAELGDAGLDEVFLGLGKTAEVAVDLLEQIARHLVAAAVRLHPLPEVQMVVVLTGIVEEAGVLAERGLDDLFERLALEAAALEQLVAVVDISLVVLVVMIFERFAGHIWRERIVGVGQIRQLECHR